MDDFANKISDLTDTDLVVVTKQTAYFKHSIDILPESKSSEVKFQFHY